MNVSRVSRWLQEGQRDRAVREILRAPDRAIAHQPSRTFVDLREHLVTHHADDGLREAVLRFLEALYAYRAGLTPLARDTFAAYLDRFSVRGEGGPLWPLECAAKWSLALALRRLGSLEEGLQVAREAAGDASEAGSRWLEGAARLAMGRILRGLPGEQARARASLGEAYRLLSAARPADPLGVAYVRAHEAGLALDEGQAFRALSLIREARSGFGRSRHTRALALSRVFQGEAHLQLGAVRAAIECGQEARAQLEAMAHQRGVLRALRLLARAALDEGRSADAREGFERVAEGARQLGDGLMEAEAYVGVAKARLAAGSLRGVLPALRKAEPARYTAPISAAGAEWLALNLVRRIRLGPLAAVPAGLRELRGALRQRSERRLKAECLAACGFELARKGHLREAAPLLKESLGQVARADAVAWTERFLTSVRSVDVRQWITSLVTEMHEREDVAARYTALVVCAYGGLHDAKNLAFSAWADLELLETERAPDADEPEEERRLVEEVNRLLPLLRREYPRALGALNTAKDKAFRTSELARDVAQQVLSGQTELHAELQAVDIRALLSTWRDDIERRPGLGPCRVSVGRGVSRALTDERLLARVFENLTSNAERYAPKSKIELSARVRRGGSRQEVVIGFADHGPGIHPEDLEIIFEPFKDPARYRDQSGEHGLGFGLYYCRKVLEAHGGEMWAESRLGEGARFYLALAAGK